MPSFASVVLTDGEATPVNHTFTPTGIMQNVATWHDRSATYAIGYPRLTIAWKDPAPAGNGQGSNSRYRKVTSRLEIPYLETSGTNDAGFTPPPTVAYTDRVETTYTLSERGTVQGRENLRVMNNDLQAESLMVALVDNFENVY